MFGGRGDVSLYYWAAVISSYISFTFLLRLLCSRTPSELVADLPACRRLFGLDGSLCV